MEVRIGVKIGVRIGVSKVCSDKFENGRFTKGVFKK